MSVVARQVAGYTALLLHFLGPSVFAGIAAMLLIVPLNAFFFDRYAPAAATRRHIDVAIIIGHARLSLSRVLHISDWSSA